MCKSSFCDIARKRYESQSKEETHKHFAPTRNVADNFGMNWVQTKEKANDELKENIAKLETQNEEAIAIAKHEAKLKLDEKLKEAEDIHKAELQEKNSEWESKLAEQVEQHEQVINNMNAELCPSFIMKCIQFKNYKV